MNQTYYKSNISFRDIKRNQAESGTMEGFLKEILSGNVEYFLGYLGFLLDGKDSTNEIMVFHGDLDTIRILFSLIAHGIKPEYIETVPLKEYLDPCNSYRFNPNTLFNISLYDDEMAKEYLKKDVDIYRTFNNIITEGSYPKMVFVSEHFPETLEEVKGEYTADFKIEGTHHIYNATYLQQLIKGIPWLYYAAAVAATDIKYGHSFKEVDSIELPDGSELELII